MDILTIDNRLPMYNGDFQLVNEIEEIKQHIVTALNTFYTDWLLDFTKGIDFAYDLKNDAFLEHDIKKQILDVNGVLAILNFNTKHDRTTNNIEVVAGIKTIYGKLEINEVISQ